MLISGKNVFNEFKNDLDKINMIYIENSFKEMDILDYIKRNNLNHKFLNKNEFNKMFSGNNQKIGLDIKDYEYIDFNNFDYNTDFVLILDHLSDPHNFGAIIRTCEAAGVKNIIIPKDRSVKITPTVYKTSTGAINYVNIYRVTNLKNTIDILKDNDFFIYAAEAGGKLYNEVNFADKKVLIIGSEGFGISKSILKESDEIISIPLNGHVNSLNASVAAGVLIYGIK